MLWQFWGRAASRPEPDGSGLFSCPDEHCPSVPALADRPRDIACLNGFEGSRSFPHEKACQVRPRRSRNVATDRSILPDHAALNSAKLDDFAKAIFESCPPGTLLAAGRSIAVYDAAATRDCAEYPHSRGCRLHGHVSDATAEATANSRDPQSGSLSGRGIDDFRTAGGDSFLSGSAR